MIWTFLKIFKFAKHVSWYEYLILFLVKCWEWQSSVSSDVTAENICYIFKYYKTPMCLFHLYCNFKSVQSNDKYGVLIFHESKYIKSRFILLKELKRCSCSLWPKKTNAVFNSFIWQTHNTLSHLRINFIHLGL